MDTTLTMVWRQIGNAAAQVATAALSVSATFYATALTAVAEDHEAFSSTSATAADCLGQFEQAVKEFRAVLHDIANQKTDGGAS